MSDPMRVRNAAPQIGYVEVTLDRLVDSPVGLWLAYDVVSGTAANNVDYLGSRFRRVSNDPTTERDGIIIPTKESVGRIYFTARSDAISEPTETIIIALAPFSFEGGPAARDYVIANEKLVKVEHHR